MLNATVTIATRRAEGFVNRFITEAFIEDVYSE